MSDEDTDISLNRRNTSAVKEELKNVNAKLAAQKVQIDGLLSTITTLSERLNKIELSEHMRRAMAAGNGPSVK